jgi:hypothetical protein
MFSTRYDSTESPLINFSGDLKLKISNSIVTLGSKRTQQVSNLATNVIEGSRCAATIYQYGSYASGGYYKWLYGGLIAGFSLLAVGNICAYQMTTKQLEEHQELLREVDRLGDEVRMVMSDITNIEMWLLDISDDE